MTNRTTRGIVACAIVGIAGCGVPLQTHPTHLDHNGVRVIVPASSTSLPPGTPTRHAELCLVSGDHLVPVLVELATPLSVARTLRALVDAPTAGLRPGTRSAINDPNLLTAGATTRGVARVDLNANFTQIAPTDQTLALAQVVCTLTSLPGIGQVRFTQDGQPIDIPRGDSSLTNQPVSRYDYKQLLPTP